MSAVGGEPHIDTTPTAAAAPTARTGEGAGPSMVGNDVLSAVNEFESRVTAFKALYAQSQAMQLEAEQRRLELGVLEAELNGRVQRTAEREQELIRIDAELASRRGEVDAAMEAAEKLRAELSAQSAEAAAQLEQRQAEVDSRAVQVAAAEETLNRSREEQARRDEQIAERERKAAQTEANAKKIREAEQALSQRIGELNKRQQQLKDECALLAEAKREATEQTAAVERDRVLLAEQQRDAEVQAQALAADRMALEALEREATEESSRLAALRTELEAKATMLAERDRRLTEDQTRVGAERTEEAQQLGAALTAAREDLARERAAHADLMIVVEEYEQLWLLELRESARLATAVGAGTAGADSQRTDIADLGQLVEGLKDRLRTEITAARALREELEQVREERDAAIQQTEKAFSKARHAAPGRSMPVESLERRRRRLKVLRELLRKQARKIHKAGESLKKRYEQVDQVLAQRAELAAARNKIIAAEKRVTRSHAASRAAVVVLCGVGVFSLLGAMSWAVAREIAPATFEAVSIVKAEGRDRELSEAELQEWQSFHEELLRDPRFHEAAADRFKRQGNPTLSNAGGVAELVSTKLTTESLKAGELQLRLTGTGAEPTARTLETFTAGFMGYANSGHGKRLDGGTTVASQPAMAGDAPIDSVRTVYTLVMMGVGMVVSMLAAGFLWRRLVGVKTAFEQDAKLAETLEETRWTSVER